VSLTSHIINRCLGEQPNRPLLALTTLLMPGRFMAELYRNSFNRTPIKMSRRDARGNTSGAQTRPDWGEKKAAFTLSFDLDLEEDIDAIPWLIETLAPYPFKASFALIGKWVEIKPEAHAAIVKAGHEIINHTYSHPWSEIFNPRPFPSLDHAGQLEEIARGHETIYKLLGVAPIGFRLPHLESAPSIYPMLHDLGYRYSSSALSRRTQVTPFLTNDAIWEFPLSQCPRHPSSVFDTYHAFRSTSKLFQMRREDEDTFFDSFRELLALSIATGAHLNVYFDPMDVRRFANFGRFLDHVIAHENDLMIGSYRDLLPVLEKSRC
jgi:peptidoglycan/xylan/chitin deacetylase (PgdA/CDA1 family)